MIFDHGMYSVRWKACITSDTNVTELSLRKKSISSRGKFLKLVELYACKSLEISKNLGNFFQKKKCI